MEYRCRHWQRRCAPIDSLRGLKVLLAEDNDFNQEVATGILSDAGLIVDVAGDGAAALQMAQADVYDIILMDMQMPVMDGVTATREIRALGAAVEHCPSWR